MKNFFAKLKPHMKPLPPDTTGRNLNVVIATLGGVGRLRPAPGTLGTLAATVPGYFIMYYAGPIGLAIAAALLMWVGTITAGYYGRKSGDKDDQTIVVDEAVGLWIAAIPAGTDLGLWFLAFILFRIFDIYKPWPASYFDKKAETKSDEKYPGLDVMLDDVVAGIYAFPGVAAAAYFIAMSIQ